MKIVIDIDEEILQAIKAHQVLPSQIDIICEAVLGGTPLPKGHGRLIDADWVKNTLDIYVINEYNGQFIRRSDIDTIPTIIEGSDSE